MLYMATTDHMPVCLQQRMQYYMRLRNLTCSFPRDYGWSDYEGKERERGERERESGWKLERGSVPVGIGLLVSVSVTSCSVPWSLLLCSVCVCVCVNE